MVIGILICRWLGKRLTQATNSTSSSTQAWFEHSWCSLWYFSDVFPVSSSMWNFKWGSTFYILIPGRRTFSCSQLWRMSKSSVPTWFWNQMLTFNLVRAASQNGGLQTLRRKARQVLKPKTTDPPGDALQNQQQPCRHQLCRFLPPLWP